MLSHPQILGHGNKHLWKNWVWIIPKDARDAITTNGPIQLGQSIRAINKWICLTCENHKKVSTKGGIAMTVTSLKYTVQNVHGINKIQVIFRKNLIIKNTKKYFFKCWDPWMKGIIWIHISLLLFQEGIPIKWVYRQFTLNVSLTAILIKGNIIHGKYVLDKTRAFNLSWLLVDTQIQTSQTILQTIQITELDKY